MVVLLKFGWTEVAIDGNTVAVAFGTVGIGKWVWDSIARWNRKNNESAHTGEISLLQLRSDFTVHTTEDRKEFQYIKEALEDIKENTGKEFDRVNQKIDQLQAQIRFVSTGTNNRLYTSKENKDEQ